MKNPLRFLSDHTGKMLLVLGLGLLGAATAKAQNIVYVSSYTGSGQTAFPPLGFVSGSGFSGFGSTALGSPSDAPSRTRTVYGYSADCVWKIQPTLGVAGAVYKIETAHTAATTSPDVLMTLSTADGDLSASCTNTTAFNAAHGGNTWQLIGYITNYPGVTQPTIFFTTSGGTLGPASSQNRLYFDAFKFTEQGNPCAGVAGDVTVVGPLVANQQFINVAGVDGGASTVTVYADDGIIGTLESPSIVAGVNSVPTSVPLSQNSVIKATQTKNGCTSPMPVSGPAVGGGANPPITAFLSCYMSAAFAGPVGANTTSGLSTNYTLEAGGLRNGSQSAPIGGIPLDPSRCWQTVTFNQSDTAIFPNNGFTADGTVNPYCALDALVFAIDPSSPNTGPYDIYIDQIKNGDVVIEDFESYPVGSTNTFIAPALATIPSAAVNYLTNSTSAVISTNNAFDGTKSCRIRWQYLDTSNVRWARIVAGAATGKRNPQLDTTKPVTIRYLVLPVGETNDTIHFPTVPASRQTLLTNSSVTWTVAAGGQGGFTYQWKRDGNNIDTATKSSLTLNNLQLSDAGNYSVVVTGQDGAGCTETLDTLLSIVETKPILNYSVATTNITLSWTGSFMLQSSTNLPGTWNDVSSTSPVTQTISKTKFYRLRP